MSQSALLTAIVLVSYGSTFSSLWALWQTSDHRHGILVFPIVAFLVWRSRQELADVPLRADPRGLPLLLVLVIAWSTIHYIKVNRSIDSDQVMAFHDLSLPLILSGLLFFFGVLLLLMLVQLI